MEVSIILITKNNCGICNLMKGTWRRLQTERPDYLFTENVMYSDGDISLMATLYKVDEIPHIAIIKDGEHVGDIIGMKKLQTLLEEIDNIIGE